MILHHEGGGVCGTPWKCVILVAYCPPSIEAIVIVIRCDRPKQTLRLASGSIPSESQVGEVLDIYLSFQPFPPVPPS